MIDLHVHSSASDGTVGPRRLDRLAGEAWLEAIGITDHDSVDGIPKFLDECRSLRIEGVARIEIGVEYRWGTMRVVG